VNVVIAVIAARSPCRWLRALRKQRAAGDAVMFTSVASATVYVRTTVSPDITVFFELVNAVMEAAWHRRCCVEQPAPRADPIASVASVSFRRWSFVIEMSRLCTARLRQDYLAALCNRSVSRTRPECCQD